MNGGMDMTGKSYSNKANSNGPTIQREGEQDWCSKPLNEVRKAEESVEKLKREAQEQLNEGKESFHNPS